MKTNFTENHLSKEEAARYLARSPRWLDHQLASPHPPPAFKFGKRWLFKRTELDAWLEQFRAGTNLDHHVHQKELV